MVKLVHKTLDVSKLNIYIYIYKVIEVVKIN